MRYLAAFIAIALLSNCKSKQKSGLEEEMDAINDPGIFQARRFPYDTLKQTPYLSGQMATKPWSDTYWPLDAAGLASRWIDMTADFDLSADASKSDFLTVIDGKIRAAVSSATTSFGKPADKTAYVSPAEKIDLVLDRRHLPLFRYELTQYKQNSMSFNGIEWGWMGHCHGWAAASYMEPAPQHGVLLTSAAGQEVFFSPGDIRAVMTKAASDYGYSGQEQFLGGRCNDPAAQIPRDIMGRIVDASLGVYDPDNYLSSSIPIKIDHNGWDGLNEVNDKAPAVIGRVGPRYQNQPQVWVSSYSVLDQGKDVYGVRVYSTKKGWFGRILRDQILVGKTADEVGVFVDSKGKPILDNGKPKRDEVKARQIWKAMTGPGTPGVGLQTSNDVAFKYWKSCRDANPGAFHLILVSLLSKGVVGNSPTHGFIVDITRDEQVWNHPVYRFESEMGDPTPLNIDNVEDPYKEWRAPGTQQIVDVHTTIEYGIENGPFLTYKPADERTRTMRLRYTLELNARGAVLGGEWHPVIMENSKPQSGKDLLSDLQHTAKNFVPELLRHPDFIWGPKPAATINDGALIPAKLISKLKECTAKDPKGQTFFIDRRNIPTVSCKYN
jgi:hypothetical protein